MTKTPPARRPASPPQPSSQEGALAQALAILRHTEACHKSYATYKECFTKLQASQNGCSRCHTRENSRPHITECKEAYSDFMVAKKLHKSLSESCKKCQARLKLQGVIR